MPSLAESTKTYQQLQEAGYKPVEASAVNKPTPSPDASQEPVYTGYIRCPLPILSNSTPDSLRTYYINGKVPQYRIFNPPSK